MSVDGGGSAQPSARIWQLALASPPPPTSPVLADLRFRAVDLPPIPGTTSPASRLYKRAPLATATWNLCVVFAGRGARGAQIPVDCRRHSRAVAKLLQRATQSLKSSLPASIHQSVRFCTSIAVVCVPSRPPVAAVQSTVLQCRVGWLTSASRVMIGIQPQYRCAVAGKRAHNGAPVPEFTGKASLMPPQHTRHRYRPAQLATNWALLATVYTRFHRAPQPRVAVLHIPSAKLHRPITHSANPAATAGLHASPRPKTEEEVARRLCRSLNA